MMAKAVAVKPTELLSPSIARRTKRILALQEKGKAKLREMANIIADIGDELIAVKEELDRGPDKTAWMKWLKEHVHYTYRTAVNYINVAKMRKENVKTFSHFLAMDSSCLYRVACMTKDCRCSLTPETKLTDPRTGEKKPMKEMSARQLDRALDKLQGKKIVEEPSPSSGKSPDIETGRSVPSGDDRESFAASVRAAILKLAEEAGRMRSLGGKLQGESKRSAISAMETLREALLRWPAWAKK